MALAVTDADAYIAANCIDIDDWSDADEAKKQRIINVANRTLTTKYAQYTVPDAAVYETANALAIVFNDTNKLGQYGIQSQSISGVASFTYRDGAKELAQMIPQTALDLISAENGGVKLSKRTVGWTVL